MNPPELRKAEAEVSGIIEERQALQIALAASKPLAVELLLDSDKRRVSIEEVEAFRNSINRPCDRFDEIDEAAADPIHDHRPQSAPKHKVRGVLSILDQLEKENTNRRFKP